MLADPRAGGLTLSEVLELTIPALHAGQEQIDAESAELGVRFVVIVNGRRWGKTVYAMFHKALAIAMNGGFVGWFTPNRDLFQEAWDELIQYADVAIESSNSSDGVVRFKGGGKIDFWTLHNNPRPARSYKYHLVVVDECGEIPNLIHLWNRCIRATLMDYQGSAIFAGTPNGKGDFFELFNRGRSEETRWARWGSWQMPSSSNPYVLPIEIEEAREEMDDRSFRQEWLAEFLGAEDGVFAGVRKLVDQGSGESLYDPDDRESGKKGSAPIALVRPGNGAQIGIDVAKSRDYVVITVLDETGKQLEIHRWRGQGFAVLVDRAIAIAERHPDAILRIDSTGLGDPVYEQLRIALGHDRVEGFHIGFQSKHDLIDGLVLKVERGGLRLLDHAAQTEELESYELQTTPKGRSTYNAPKGLHDDCVIALALAAWGLRAGAARQRTFAFYG